MSEDLETNLKKALQAVNPPKDISVLVAARLNVTNRRPSARLRAWGWPVGLAATVLLVAGYQYQRHQQAVAAGLEARRQLIEALHVTNEKLDLAFKAVHDMNQKVEERGSGA